MLVGRIRGLDLAAMGESARDCGVLTVLGNDARYVGQCILHVASQGCLALGQFSAPPSMSAHGKAHRSRPPVLWSLARDLRPISPRCSDSSAELPIPRSRGPDR